MSTVVPERHMPGLDGLGTRWSDRTVFWKSVSGQGVEIESGAPQQELPVPGSDATAKLLSRPKEYDFFEITEIVDHACESYRLL